MIWGLSDAVVRVGGGLALDRVTIDVDRASICVVVGGDGAGKSTCLRALVGLVDLDGGSSRRPPKESIGYVPAVGGLYGDLSVEESIAFGGACYGMTRKEVQQRAGELLELVGLGHSRARLCGQLSGGMQRKLALVLALLHGPELLVLDEPSTGIDPMSRAELWRLLSAEAASGTAVVLSTTYVNEASRAGHVLVLDQGRAVAQGRPDEVVAAVPGAVGEADTSLGSPERSWRWGRSWRVWAPDAALPDGARPVALDLQDAVIVTELELEARGTVR